MNLEEKLIYESAELRAKGKFNEAIQLIEESLDNGDISPEMTLNAHLEIFYAAREDGNEEKAATVAKEIAKEDPNVPSIQDFI